MAIHEHGSVSKIKRVQGVARRFGTGLSPIGDFHSHAQLGTPKGIAELSTIDGAGIVTGMTYTVLSLNEFEDCYSWERAGKKTIIGRLEIL